eukprot:TCALIF_02755-PA protein Name:"Similar to Nap1 Nef-associated protein 1 (Rattus norvegicus)" AED:0.02 eAED:0.02 QI:0/0/0/0.5/1/1/2/0/320
MDYKISGGVCILIYRSNLHGLRQKHLQDVQKIRASLAQLHAESAQPVAPLAPDAADPPPWDWRPIGTIHSCFQSKNGTPRQSGLSPTAVGTLILHGPELNGGIHNLHYALQGLSGFSHVWLLFVFHRNNGPKQFVKTKVCPPRLKERVGLFSTRSPHRPNPIGLTLAKIEAVFDDRVELSGIDLIQDTPVLDIKPYIPDYDSPWKAESHGDTKVRTPKWINNPNDDLSVIFSPTAAQQLANLEGDLDLRKLKGPGDLNQAIVEVLRADPRSVYRQERCQDQIYHMTVDHGVHVSAWFDQDNREVMVLKVKKTVTDGQCQE